MELFELIQTLNRAHGPSGDEGEIREVIRALAEPYADEITADTMGSLIVHRRGKGPKLLLAAHMVFARDSAIRANPLLIHIHIAAVVSKGRIIPCSGLFDWVADVLFIRMRTAKATSRADSVRIAVRFVYPFLAHIVFRDFLFAVRTNPSLIVLDLVLVMRI